MTATEVLAQKKSSSVLGRGLAEIAKDNMQQPTNFPATQTEKKSLSELKVEIKFHLGQMAGHAVEIGKLLIQAKEQVNHGEWQQWLEDNFNLTQQSANRFMRVAERFGKLNIDVQFNSTQMITMLALPEGEEENFIAAKAAQGTPVEDMTIKNLREEIKSYKEQLLQAEQDRDDYNEQNLNLQEKVKELEKELTAKETATVEVTPPDYESTKAELANVKSELEEALSTKETVTVEVAPADYESMKAELENVKAELKSLQEKSTDYEKTKAELAALKDKLQNVKKETARKVVEFFAVLPLLTNIEYADLHNAIENFGKENPSGYKTAKSNFNKIKMRFENIFKTMKF